MNAKEQAEVLTDEQAREIAARRPGQRFNVHDDQIPTMVLEEVARRCFPDVEFFVALATDRGPDAIDKWKGWLAAWGETFRFEEGMEQWAHGGLMCNAIRFGLRPATIEEADAFTAILEDVRRGMRERIEVEARLLSLCGLKHEDFVRFRNVHQVDDGDVQYLSVETRENGIGGRSSNAIKNPNYVKSVPDEGDATYEYYLFKIPS